MGPLCLLIKKKTNWVIITKWQELLQPAGYILQFVKKFWMRWLWTKIGERCQATPWNRSSLPLFYTVLANETLREDLFQND